MNITRLTSTLLAASALVGAAASDASADSVAYVKGGDVFLSTSDGSRQFQVTTGGGYDHVAQADDGTLLASTTADSHLRRLNRLGTVLSDIATPVSDHSPGVIRFQGPFDASISPDGHTLGYGYIESGLFEDPTTHELTAETKNGAGFSAAATETGFTDEGYKHSNDWDAPQFVDNSNVLLSNGPSDPYDDTIATEVVGSGAPINWFSDPAVPHPTQATISRNKLVIAAVNGPQATELHVYHDTNGVLGKAPGDPLNVENCFTYSGSGIATPTFNPDGSRGWWRTSAGIVTAPFAMGAAGCGAAVNATTIIPGASSPAWGPADVPTGRPFVPVPSPKPGPKPKPNHTTLPASLKVTLGHVSIRQALRGGLTVTVRGGKGTVSASATAGRKTVAAGRSKNAKVTLRFTAAAKRSLARQRRVTLKIRVARGASRSTLTAKLAR